METPIDHRHQCPKVEAPWSPQVASPRLSLRSSCITTSVWSKPQATRSAVRPAKFVRLGSRRSHLKVLTDRSENGLKTKCPQSQKTKKNHSWREHIHTYTIITIYIYTYIHHIYYMWLWFPLFGWNKFQTLHCEVCYRSRFSRDGQPGGRESAFLVPESCSIPVMVKNAYTYIRTFMWHGSGSANPMLSW